MLVHIILFAETFVRGRGCKDSSSVSSGSYCLTPCLRHGGPSAAAVLGQHRLNARPPPASARPTRSRHVCSRSRSPSPCAPLSHALQSLRAPSSSSSSTFCGFSLPAPPSVVALPTKGTGMLAKRRRIPSADVSNRDEQTRRLSERRKAV